MTMVMIRNLFDTMRGLFTSPRALAIFAGLYALLLATLYLFVSTREATAWQVIVTLFFLILIPAEFFILQAAGVDHALDGKINFGRVLRDSCKLAVVTIPIILLGYLLWFLLNKWQVHYPPPLFRKEQVPVADIGDADDEHAHPALGAVNDPGRDVDEGTLTRGPHGA